MSNNIPNITDICGTVVESLAETIRNREALIAELREENARAEHLLLTRDKQVTELREQVKGWRAECEAHEKDEKELYALRDEVRRLKTQLLVSHNSHMDCDRQCKELLAENENLKQDFGRGDAYWTAISQRDEARRSYCELAGSLEHKDPADIAKHHKWDDLYADPSIRAQHVAEQSDTDPETGVQYGDLI